MYKNEYGESFESIIDLTLPEDQQKDDHSISSSEYISFESNSRSETIGRSKNQSVDSIYKHSFYSSIHDDLPEPQTPFLIDNIITKKNEEEMIVHDIQILDHISGYIHANEMTAILGARYLYASDVLLIHC